MYHIIDKYAATDGWEMQVHIAIGSHTRSAASPEPAFSSADGPHSAASHWPWFAGAGRRSRLGRRPAPRPAPANWVDWCMFTWRLMTDGYKIRRSGRKGRAVRISAVMLHRCCMPRLPMEPHAGRALSVGQNSPWSRFFDPLQRRHGMEGTKPDLDSKPVVDRNGKPRLLYNLHELRHAAASRLIEQNWDAKKGAGHG